MKFTLMILMLSIGTLLSQELEMSNKALVKGNYQEAITGFNSLVVAGKSSAGLYHNLALAYWQINDLGNARLAIERAYLYEPTNSKIKESRDLLIQAVDSGIIPVEPFFISKIIDSLARLLSPLIWVVITFFVALLMLYFVVKNKESLYNLNAKSNRTIISVFSLGLLTLFIGNLGLQSYALKYMSTDAVVLKTTSLHDAPDLRSEEVLKLKPGCKVVALDEVNNWVQVLLQNKESGWVVKEEVSSVLEY